MTNVKKSILLVGGAGYIGTQLAKALGASYAVFSTSRSGGDNQIQLDYLNRATYFNILMAEKYDYIVLLASTLNGIGTTALKREYLEGNTTGLANFLQFLSEQSLSDKLVYISSMAVYGSDAPVPVKENVALNPISTYGLGKKIAEQIFDFYCSSNASKGAILRIPGVYGGTRKSGFVYHTVLKCTKNEPIELNTSSLGFWETIHVEDLCSWLKEFIEKYDWKKNVEVFNLNYGVSTDIIACAHAIKKVLKSSSEIKVVGEKGYVEFYLDNNKIKKYVGVKDSYISSLEKYALTLER